MPLRWSARAHAFALSALLLQCGQSRRTTEETKGDGAAPPALGEPGLCSEDAWCWENPTPQGHYLNGIWTAPSGEVWAVGQEGTILRRHGDRWSREEPVTTSLLTTVWGAADDDIWAAGDEGTLLHYDGSAWQRVASPTTELLWSISGAAGEAWAVGEHGIILHLRDGSWSLDTSPAPERTLYGVWALSPTDVYAVGSYTRILHFDGVGWETVQSTEAMRQSDRLTKIWARSATDIYAVGGKAQTSTALAFHFDGVAWTEVSPTGVQLYAIHGAADAQTAWALGSDSPEGPTTVWRVEEAAFTPAATFEAQYSAITAGDDGNVWAAGADGALLHESAGRFTLGSSTVRDHSGLSGAWALGPDDIWTVGAGGAILHFDGTRWTPVESNTPSDLSAVHGTGPDDIWAVGRDSTLVHFDGETWAVIRTGAHDTWTSSVLASAPDDVWVSTFDRDGAVVEHFDGETWSTTYGDFLPIQAFWSATPGDVWALGSRVFHYRDGTWIRELTELGMMGMWGLTADDAWMVGSGGVILHYDGREFVPQTSPVTENLYAVSGVSNERIYAAGDDGVILHYDGQTWQRESASSRLDFRSVLMTDESTVRLFTDGTGILKKVLP